MLWALWWLLWAPASEGRPTPNPYPENVSVEVRVQLGSSWVVLPAQFDGVGSNYEAAGHIVEMSFYRACEKKIRDQTLQGHVVVLFIEPATTILAGCVSLENQARFAYESGARALIVGPSTHLKKPLNNGTKVQIPVVSLADSETTRLESFLHTATQQGFVANAVIEFIDVPTLRVQVFRPTLLNISLLFLLFLLVVFVSVVLVLKFRWKPSAHHELWMRAMAMAALKNMETRKYSKACQTKRGFRGLLPRLNSVISVAHTTSTSAQERCSICLDELIEGTVLRVLLCGHEFHSSCVDPWLLAKRRCPLCQFDVVTKRWPEPEKNNKGEPPTTTEENHPLLNNEPTPVHQPLREMPASSPRSYRRSRSIPRRRPLRDRQFVNLGPLGTVSGYSSDVSSHPDAFVDV